MDFRKELAKYGYTEFDSIDVETLIDEILPSLFSQQEKSYTEEDILPLLEFIEDCDSNWDCDSDSHRYDTNCRACDAKKTLLQFKKK